MTKKEVINELELRYAAEHEEYKKQYDSYHSGAMAAIDEAIQIVEKLDDTEQKWIPVSERLPKEYETVIGVTDLNYCCIAVYCKQYGFRTMDVGAESDIIAWQPLPEPYKAGEQE